MQSLLQLDLRGNPLERLPAAIARLPRLQKLDLRWVDSLQTDAGVRELEARGCLVYR